MLMHAIAHRGRTDTVRESALKVDPGKKKHPLPHQGSKAVSVCAGLTLYPLSCIPAPSVTQWIIADQACLMYSMVIVALYEYDYL